MSESPVVAGRRPWWLGPGPVWLICVAFWGVLVGSVWHKSLTFDEVAHAVAGYTYWHDGDFRLQPENGQLPQRLAGLALLRGNSIPKREPAELWRESRVYELGFQWFYEQGNDADAMARRGRAVCALLAVGLAVLVWAWARSLFGPTAALVALLLFVLNPAVLANGALMTSDTAAALGFAGATWAWWRVLEQFTWRRLLVSALAMGGLFVAKMSAVLIAPIALALLVVAVATRRLAFRRVGLLLAVHAFVACVVIWTCYGFRYSAFKDETGRFAVPWEYMLGKPEPAGLLAGLQLSPEQQQRAGEILVRHGAPAAMWLNSTVDAIAETRREVLSPDQANRLDVALAQTQGPLERGVEFARAHRLLPEAWLYGFTDVYRRSQYRSAFLNGETSVTGWWWFFPYTFGVKTPLPFLAVLGIGLVGWAQVARKRTEILWATLPLAALLAVYGGAALLTHLNIGHRHILPLYGPLCVLAGASVCEAGRRTRWIVAMLVGLLGLETAWHFPNYLAYFNGVVAPREGYRHLVDSSLDWGQELPAIKKYVDRQSDGRPVYLSYFGSGDPDYYGIRARALHSFSGRHLARSPAMFILPLSPAAAGGTIARIERERPEYELLTATQFSAEVVSVWIRRPAALRLTAGTYVISATMLQPLYYSPGGPWGSWTREQEAIYQDLHASVKPLLEDDAAARATALNRWPPGEWPARLARYEEFRFARLTAFLRSREPDDLINGSVLVFRLTESDLARALDGPPMMPSE